MLHEAFPLTPPPSPRSWSLLRVVGYTEDHPQITYKVSNYLEGSPHPAISSSPSHLLSLTHEMSVSISSTHNDNSISPSTLKWMVAGSGGMLHVWRSVTKANPPLVLFLFALGTFLYLAHRRRTQRVPSVEENRIRPSHPRARPATKIAFPVSGVARGHLYVHRGVPSPRTSAASPLRAMPPIRRDKLPEGSVLSPGS